MPGWRLTAPLILLVGPPAAGVALSATGARPEVDGGPRSKYPSNNPAVRQTSARR